MRYPPFVTTTLSRQRASTHLELITLAILKCRAAVGMSAPSDAGQDRQLVQSMYRHQGTTTRLNRADEAALLARYPESASVILLQYSISNDYRRFPLARKMTSAIAGNIALSSWSEMVQANRWHDVAPCLTRDLAIMSSLLDDTPLRVFVSRHHQEAYDLC